MTLSIFDAAREAPDTVALIAGDVRLTYAELGARVEQRLAELREARLLDPEGERPVAVVAHPTVAVVETLLALAAAGTPALLLHARLSVPERDLLCRQAGAVVEAPASAGSTRRTATDADPAPFDAERIAALVPTSGSTGTPRIVRLSHRAFLAAGELTAERFGREDGDRWLLALPLAHIGGLGMLFRCVMHRSTLVLFEPRRSVLAELDRLVQALEEHSVTLLSLVPTLLARLLEPHAFRPPPSLRMVLLGGSPIPRELVARARGAGIPVVPTYGMTETCASAVLGTYAERLVAPAPGGELLASGTAGRSVELRLVDGLVELRGETLFSGYLGEPSSDPRRGWVRTLDRGALDEHGELTVTGRATDVIITGAENVDPAEVEAALMALPGVRLACVIGVPDPTFGELVTALIVPSPDARLSTGTVAAELDGRIAPHKRPRRIELVAELPLTAAGKLDRRAARSAYVSKR